MFGSVGGTELLVILLLGLLIFGPRRLPEIGRTLGKALAEFRRATQELKETIEKEVDLKEADIRGELSDLRRISPSPRAAEPPTIPVPPDDTPAPSSPSDERTPRS